MMYLAENTSVLCFDSDPYNPHNFTRIVANFLQLRPLKGCTFLSYKQSIRLNMFIFTLKESFNTVCLYNYVYIGKQRHVVAFVKVEHEANRLHNWEEITQPHNNIFNHSWLDQKFKFVRITAEHLEDVVTRFSIDDEVILCSLGVAGMDCSNSQNV